jgi:hypothetical protein
VDGASAWEYGVSVVAPTAVSMLCVVVAGALSTNVPDEVRK